MNGKVVKLLEHTEILYKGLNALIQKEVARIALAQSASPSKSGVIAEGSIAESKLEREEVAKLLLLVSKAAQNGYITELRKG